MESTECSRVNVKTLLVCFGERKRPITLPAEASVSDLKLQIVQEYRDVLPQGSSSTDETIAESLILQVKAENWDGVFVDVKNGDDIVDKSVLRIVTANPQVYSSWILITSHFVTILFPLFPPPPPVYCLLPMHGVFCLHKEVNRTDNNFRRGP